MRISRAKRLGQQYEQVAWRSERGATLMTAVVILGVVGLVLLYTFQRAAATVATNQSDLLKSDFAAIERNVADNISCPKTLGAPLTLCSPGVVLRGSDGAVLTDNTGSIGGFKITTKCIDATASDPNKRLLITAQANRPDPLFPAAGLATYQLFKGGANGAVPYPCTKYLNVGPRYKVATMLGNTGTFKMDDCSCGTAGVTWCHNKATATCPAGYLAVSANTDCAYNYSYNSVPAWGNFQQGAVGSVPSAKINADQGYIDCCAPNGAPQNPLYLVCIRS